MIDSLAIDRCMHDWIEKCVTPISHGNVIMTANNFEANITYPVTMIH